MKSRKHFIQTTIDGLRERLQEERVRTMWRSFLSALGLLGVAMLCALYSSSAARQGHMLPAAISAILALAIAVGVGVRFVPRLAANVEWNWLPFISQYQVTREGWIYFAAITVVVLAAINTNNNLLYMVLSGLMAVLLLSGFVSALNFRGLQITLRLPEHCFAGQTFAVSIGLRNQKMVFPSLSLTIENAKNASFRLRSFYSTCIHGQSTRVQTSEALLPRRGRYQIEHVKIVSRFPFGFFVKGRDYPVDATCICYPELLPREQIHLAAVDIVGSEQGFERGSGIDLYMIRNYLPSDSARHVHWKASAKTATLKTREFAAEESHRVTLCLDRFAAHGDETRFENLVSYAASLAVYLAQDGTDVALATDEWHTGYGSSESHIETILEYLALVSSSVSAADPQTTTDDGMLMLSLRRESQLS